MPHYFASITTPGRVRYSQYPFTIGVLGSPDNFMPIGQASGAGYDADGAALWGLIVHGVKIPGRWVIVDRRFVAVDGDPA
jgi:hypothetical protein